MSKVAYYKVLPKFGYYEEDVTADYLHFINVVSQLMELRGEVHLVLEPGDCTRYEYLIKTLDPLSTLIACLGPGYGWCVVAGVPPFVVPGYLMSKMKNGEKAIYSIYLICQVLRDVLGVKTGSQYYDFQKSEPILPQEEAEADGQ